MTMQMGSTWKPPGSWSFISVRGLVLVAGFALALVLGACSSDQPPTQTPAPTPVTTGSPTGAPVRTAEMDRDDLDGAKAAARYFIELYPYVYNTGDLDVWRAMSHPECVFCASVVENVEELHADGGYLVGGGVAFESVTGHAPVEGNEFHTVDMTLRQEDGTRYASDGSIISEATGGHLSATVVLGRSADAWVVRGVSTEVLP